MYPYDALRSDFKQFTSQRSSAELLFCKVVEFSFQNFLNGVCGNVKSFLSLKMREKKDNIHHCSESREVSKLSVTHFISNWYVIQVPACVHYSFYNNNLS